jgi:hypothetical protein
VTIPGFAQSCVFPVVQIFVLPVIEHVGGVAAVNVFEPVFVQPFPSETITV